MFSGPCAPPLTQVLHRLRSLLFLLTRMEDYKPLGEFGFTLSPLAIGPAAWVFALLYAASSALFATLPPEAAAGIETYWGIVLLIGLPLALIAFRLLSALFESVAFAVAVIIALIVVSSAAAALLPADVAMAVVFRTYPFAALGASLGLSLLACILKRRWTRGSVPYIALHLGLVIVLAGAFMSLFLRVSGFAALAQGASASSIDMHDYVLKVARPGGHQTRAVLPFGPYEASERNVTLGTLEIHAVKIGEARAEAAAIAVTAQEGNASASATLYYREPPTTLKVGPNEYTVAFDSTEAPLPFTMTLQSTRTDYYDGAALPKSYEADIVVSDAAKRSPSEQGAEAAPGARALDKSAVTARVGVNSPVTRGGYTIHLVALDRDAAVFKIARDPGAPTLFTGGALFLAGLMWICAGRLKSARAALEDQ